MPNSDLELRSAGGGLQLRTMEDALAFGRQVVEAGLCPRGDTPASVVVKVQAGAELGISPMTALSQLTAINGRIGMFGTLALALIRRSAELEGQIRMGHEGEGEDACAWIETKRRGDAKAERTEYSVRHAKRAGLWGKSGPWTQSPADMLMWRAVSRHAKRHWSDVLLGMEIAEVARDYGPEPRKATPRQIEAPEGPDPLLALPAGAAGPQEAAEDAEAEAPEAAEAEIVAPESTGETWTGTIERFSEERRGKGTIWRFFGSASEEMGKALIATTDDASLVERARAFVSTGEIVICEIERTDKGVRLLSCHDANEPVG